MHQHNNGASLPAAQTAGNPAHSLTAEQWDELCSVEEVIESFGLQGDPNPAAALKLLAHAAHFRFSASMMPGYVGDLFVIVGDAIDEPFSIIRNPDGRLEVA